MMKRNGMYVTNMAFTEHELKLFDQAMEKTGVRERVAVVRIALREYCRRLGVDGVSKTKEMKESGTEKPVRTRRGGASPWPEGVSK